MLKKDSFFWTPATEQSFTSLKTAMTQAPVLAMPNFSKPFVLETDACDKGMGAVLMQKGRPLAFLSKPFSSKQLGLSTYEKEFLAILMAISKWRPYLQNSHFIIKTDHESLKHLLEQRITSHLQQKGMTKLLGLSYYIQYKKGRENKVVDALSRREWNNTPATCCKPWFNLHGYRRSYLAMMKTQRQKKR